MSKFLQNENMVKILAIVIALLLWLIVRLDSIEPGNRGTTSSEKRETVSNVAITTIYNDEMYSVQSVSPEVVTVSMTWQDTTFRKASISDLRVEADLTNLTEGTHNVVLKAMGISSKVDTTILPAMAKVTIEKIETKQVPVMINITGTPLDGYKTGQPVVTPGRVSVSVPESLIDDVDSARASVSVEGTTDNVIKEVRLTVYDVNGRPMEGVINPQVVDVEIPINSPFKQMPIRVRLTGEPASGFSVASIQQEPEDITVYASQDILNNMDFYEGLQLDISGLKETLKTNLSVPLKNGVNKVAPESIAVSVVIVPSVVNSLTDIPLTLTGKSEGYVYNLAPEYERITINLEGAPDIVNKVRPDDIQATVDLSNLGPGLHELPVTLLNLPLNVKQQGAPIQAMVEIVKAPGSDPIGPVNPETEEPSSTPVTGSTPEGSVETSVPEDSNTPTPTPTPVPSSTPSGGTGTEGAPVAVFPFISAIIPVTPKVSDDGTITTN